MHSPTLFRYLISGLVVHSAVELPAAFLLADEASPVEVTICPGAVPDRLSPCLAEGPDWQSNPASFLLTVHGVARFLITRGTSIRFQPSPSHDPGDLALYLLGTCLAILLQQRGSLVLHASAVAVGTRAALFCGPSGAGKSTMAALLCQQGYSLLNDDTCNLTLTPAGHYTLRPDGRMLKLWSRSLAHCATPAQQGPAVRAATDKFYVRPTYSDAQPRRLAAIYLLVDAPPGESPSIQRLSPMQAMVELRQNAYRSTLIEAMHLESGYFAACAALQQDAGVYVLKRPKSFACTQPLLHLLENHWQQQNIQPAPQRRTA